MPMTTSFRIAFAVLICSILSVPAVGQDLSGTWQLEASGVIPPEITPETGTTQDRGTAVDPCIFEGGGTLVQDGESITGQASLTLVSGPPDCPDEMMADVMGSLDGLLFIGMLDGGEMFGGLNFDGTISNDGNSINGTFNVKPGGPFPDGTSGVWTAARSMVVEGIPTAGTWGLSILAALLALASLVLLRRTWA